MPVSISVRLPDETAKALSRLAGATERSKSFLVVKALGEYLSEYADYHIALGRARDLSDPVISSAELKRRLGKTD